MGSIWTEAEKTKLRKLTKQSPWYRPPKKEEPKETRGVSSAGMTFIRRKAGAAA
jgi:hypothetical protein